MEEQSSVQLQNGKTNMLTKHQDYVGAQFENTTKQLRKVFMPLDIHFAFSLQAQKDMHFPKISVEDTHSQFSYSRKYPHHLINSKGRSVFLENTTPSFNLYRNAISSDEGYVDGSSSDDDLRSFV